MREYAVPQMLRWTSRALALSAVALLGRPVDAVADDGSATAQSDPVGLLDTQADVVEVSAVQVGDVDEDGGNPPLFE